MNLRLYAIVITAFNFLLFFLLLTQTAFTPIQNVTQVIRAKTFELVDDNGNVRAQLNIEEPGNEAVFRIRDSKGTIRVKLSGTADGSGLLLLNEKTEPGVHIIVNPEGPSLSLIGKDGQKKVINP